MKFLLDGLGSFIDEILHQLTYFAFSRNEMSHLCLMVFNLKLTLFMNLCERVHALSKEVFDDKSVYLTFSLFAKDLYCALKRQAIGSCGRWTSGKVIAEKMISEPTAPEFRCGVCLIAEVRPLWTSLILVHHVEPVRIFWILADGETQSHEGNFNAMKADIVSISAFRTFQFDFSSVILYLHRKRNFVIEVYTKEIVLKDQFCKCVWRQRLPLFFQFFLVQSSCHNL